MNPLPTFSVVICNFNYAAFVGQAIASALEQDYPAERLQVIVVDDGSTDGSRDVYGRFAHDARFCAVLQENRGQSAAFAAGVERATGDYVCLLDSDDLFLPAKLQRVAARIAELDLPRDMLFLCHDLFLDHIHAATPERAAQTWFDMVGIAHLPDRWGLADAAMHFPFSIPAGLVFSRAVVAACLQAIPTWAFTRGADGILCPAALLKTGSVHYLREPLGIYRLHGGNEFASLVDGRYTPRFDPRTRAPKTLHFLERWADAQDHTAQERAVALGWLKRFEQLQRRPSASRQLEEAAVCIALLGDADSMELHAVETASLQSHARVEFVNAAAPGVTELQQMARAYAASDSEYIVFMRAGDRLDREFVERHLFWRQHVALVGVTCSDVRLVSGNGALVHAEVFRNSGAWKPPWQQVPPLATSLRDWVAPPMSACMFRRSAFLDRMFSAPAELPISLQQAGFWLAFQLQHHTAGVLRALETLGSCRLPDGAAASYGYLSAPSGADAALLEAPVTEAAHWLGQFYQHQPALFRQWLPPAWHQRFGAWLAAHSDPARSEAR